MTITEDLINHFLEIINEANTVYIAGHDAGRLDDVEIYWRAHNYFQSFDKLAKITHMIRQSGDWPNYQVPEHTEVVYLGDYVKEKYLAMGCSMPSQFSEFILFANLSLFPQVALTIQDLQLVAV